MYFHVDICAFFVYIVHQMSIQNMYFCQLYFFNAYAFTYWHSLYSNKQNTHVEAYFYQLYFSMHMHSYFGIVFILLQGYCCFRPVPRLLYPSWNLPLKILLRVERRGMFSSTAGDENSSIAVESV